MLRSRRNIYDRLSEKRIAELEKQSIAESQSPPGSYSSNSINIINAWVWLPAGVFDTPILAEDLAQRRADFDHDPRLTDMRNLRRPLQRLETPAVRSPAVGAAGRAEEILKTMFVQWHDTFCSKIDWTNTQVVLFTPTAVGMLDWMATACRLWPREQLPYYGFDVETRSVDQWLPEALVQSDGAPYLLCLSLDSWACREQMKVGPPDEMVGEAVSAVLLQRVSSALASESTNLLKLFLPVTQQHIIRRFQGRTDTRVLTGLMTSLTDRTGFEPTKVKILVGDGEFGEQRLQQLNHYVQVSLPALDLEQQIRLNTLSARVGAATEQWVQIGLGWLAASAEPGSAAWILDRRSPEQTQGWMIG